MNPKSSGSFFIDPVARVMWQAKIKKPEREILYRALRILQQAREDCASLDLNEGGSFFTDRFKKSLEHPDALRWLMRRALLPEDGKAFKPVKDGFLVSDKKGSGALALYRIRERLRDGDHPEYIVQVEASNIIGRIEEKNIWFLEQFGLLLRDALLKPESFNRSSEGWIVRCWINFALWQCGTTQEAHDILMRGLKLADKAEHPIKDFAEFERAWYNARSRRKWA